MKKYFVEYEFKSKLEKVYWFPMILHASSLEKAIELFKRFKKGLSERYEILFTSGPTLILEGLNSDRINQHVESRAHLKVCILNTNLWEMKSIKTDSELSFDEHTQLEIEKIGPLEQFPITLASGVRKNFPVRIVSGDDRMNFVEFLLIDVVYTDKQ